MWSYCDRFVRPSVHPGRIDGVLAGHFSIAMKIDQIVEDRPNRPKIDKM